LITKSRIVALLLILGVGFLVFRPGDEPSDTHGRDSDSGSTTDQQFQPREPAFLTPGQDYGVARRPYIPEAAPSYGGSGPYPRTPFSQSYSSGYGAPVPDGGQAPLQTDSYRFRPLGEREQRRMQTSYPDEHQAPHYSAHPAQRQPIASAPYMAPDRRQQAYNFRPLEKSRTSHGRWQGPYQQPGWRDNRPAFDPWTAPPDPQWGSTPPARRMYPSYSPNTSGRISAR
jgi:hypothetical protein